MNEQNLGSVQSRRATKPVFLFLGALLLGISACSPVVTITASPPAGGQATTAPKAGAPTAPAAQASARDVNSMNACALFPGADLAAALNSALVDPNTPGAGIGPTCSYYLLPSGASTGTGQFYNLFLMDPVLYDPSSKGLVNAQPVTGLGDKALMGSGSGAAAYDLIVLKSGDIMIEVNGNDAGMVQKLAEYVLNHLP